jgi:hypothetical protein
MLIKIVVVSGLIKRLVYNLVENGMSMLQYADDMIFMFQHSLDSARILEQLLFKIFIYIKVSFISLVKIRKKCMNVLISLLV